MSSPSKGRASNASESHSDPDSGGSEERIALQSEEEDGEEQQLDRGKEEGRKRGQIAKNEGEEPELDKGEVESRKIGRVDKGKEVETEVRRAVPIKLGFDEGERKQCAFPGCKFKAMASMSYCHPHILSDKMQTLFKPCNFKRSVNGEQFTCATPIPVDTVPPLCVPHKHEYNRNIIEALRNAGVDISYSENPSLLFTSIIVEYTRLIQSRRRATLKSARDAMAQKEVPDKGTQSDKEDKD